MHNRNLQNLVFERDSYTCVLCTRPASEMHHLTKRSQGGRDVPHNLVSVCRLCHLVIHGERIHGITLSTTEAKQAILEYLQDYYASEVQQGHITFG